MNMTRGMIFNIHGTFKVEPLSLARDRLEMLGLLFGPHRRDEELRALHRCIGEDL